ncbi:rRNA cytosine-C5-methyltransferase [Arachidicoccus ginsenosidivorans]|uniref:RNA methyltransferase n=1 Tax=Arachidicoccus ginsenosidivorans TaxID=496057 RepID=A0A5B8VIV4_9BACT|nr:RNA methyltransferase [Arachidicoccus ginsenosidivorans]QEC71484.1 RNA methyltransferase [Arachidicoccus ginsenosidivorans]
MSLSIPEGLIASLEGKAGFHKRSFIDAHKNHPANTSIRYNPQKLAGYKGPMPAQHGRISWSPYGYYLAERPFFTHDPLFHGGLYYVQEPGSQFLWETLHQTTDPNQRLKVLDLCAAPGGKSTLLASFFKNGLIVSNEIMKNRAAVLTENATKWGTGNIVVSCNEPSHFARLKGYFDVMIVDAPCSGSGLFRKDPVAVAQWTPALVDLCSKRQQRILQEALVSLKEGGLLIYSTCSYSIGEDEDIMDFLVGHVAMETVALNNTPMGVTTVAGTVKDRAGNQPVGYKFFPDQVRSEGFFISIFKKTKGELPAYHTGEAAPAIAKEEQVLTGPWLKPHLDLKFIKQGADILALENKWVADLTILQKNLFLKKAGVTIGQIKGKQLVPAHDLALSTWVGSGVANFPLDRAQSLQYLKCQQPEIELDGLSPGWHLASYEGIGLGWMKVLPNRINNYYPRNWRILKH